MVCAPEEVFPEDPFFGETGPVPGDPVFPAGLFAGRIIKKDLHRVQTATQ